MNLDAGIVVGIILSFFDNDISLLY